MSIVITRIVRSLKPTQGFSLVETLAALFVFSIVTLGLVPLILTSIRGSDLSRSFTVGRTVGGQAMERIRGLPFHRQVADASTNAQRVDALDLYFPRGTTTGNTAASFYTAASRMYTTICTSTTNPVTVPGCGGLNVPSGYTLTITAEFVRKCLASNTSSCVDVAIGAQERYEVVASIPSTYDWRGTAGPGTPCATCSDDPPSEILRVTVRVDWNRSGRARNYQVTSLLSERNFGGTRLEGQSEVQHLIRLQTSFDVGGQTSNVAVTGGTSRTRIEVQSISSAEHSGRAGRLLITDTLIPDTAGQDASGAFIAADAPPDVGGGSPLTSAAAGQSVAHNDLTPPTTTVAGLDTSSTSDVAAGVAVDLPQARGNAGLVDSGTPAGANGLLWMQGQMDDTNNPLHLDTAATRVAWLRTLPGVSPNPDKALTVRTQALSTAESAPTRQVVASASGSFGSLRLFPTNFIPSNSKEHALIEISDYAASITCDSRITLAAAAAASGGSYSGTVSVWVDPEDGQTNGNYEPFPITNSNQLAQYMDGVDPAARDTTPIVWEEPDAPGNVTPQMQGHAPDDVYLFPVTKTYDNVVDVFDQDNDTDVTEFVPPITKTHAGYLTDWSTLGPVTTVIPSEGEGRNVAVTMDASFSLTSEALTPGTASSVSLSIGSMSCETLDVR